MSRYDFTTLPDRTGSMAEKFCNMRALNPSVKQDVIPFSVADMDFVKPQELTQGLADFIRETIFGYTLIPGSYYDTLLGWMKRRHGLDIPREYLLDVDNVIAALRQMIRTFTQPGSGVIVMTPAYPAFLSSVEATRRRLVSCPLVLEDGRYRIDFDLLEKLCQDPDTSLLVFCNPHNPIGRLWTREELASTARICLENGVFIVSDEIHWDLILPGYSFVSMASLDETYLKNCAVSTSFTKTFNLAALKGATVIMADPDRRRKYEEGNSVPGRDLLSYAACEIAYKKCEEWLEELLQTLAANRALMKEYFADHIPEAVLTEHQATYLQWIDFRFLQMDAKALEHFMAYEAQCFFTEGYKFGEGGSGFERWNFACPQDVLLAGMERMAGAVERWKHSRTLRDPLFI